MSNLIADTDKAFGLAKAASLAASKSAVNTRETVAKIIAASETAKVESMNATESLKLKTTQVLTDSKIHMLNVMAEITTKTSLKALEVAKEAESVLALAEKNASAAKRHARSVLVDRKRVQDHLNANAQDKALRASNEALDSANEAQRMLEKALEWEKRACELLETIRSLNLAQQDTLQKACLSVDVPVQLPATDLDRVQEITGDVLMNNTAIACNMDATKQAGNSAIAGNDTVKAVETAQDATSSAVQATTNAQIALQNAEAAKQLLDQAEARSLTSQDVSEVERATVIAEEAARVSKEATAKALVATEIAQVTEKSVVSTITPGNKKRAVAYVVGLSALFLLGTLYIMRRQNRRSSVRRV